MLFQKSETVELKEAAADDIKKEIIAFANCDGGRLYIGIRDDGTVAGLDNPDGVSLQISNMVRDAIKPDVTMFLHYKTIKEDGKEIVEVDVQRGTDRPYYLAKKGMRPEGVYVRQGYSSVPTTDTAIRHMIFCFFLLLIFRVSGYQYLKQRRIFLDCQALQIYIIPIYQSKPIRGRQTGCCRKIWA